MSNQRDAYYHTFVHLPFLGGIDHASSITNGALSVVSGPYYRRFERPRRGVATRARTGQNPEACNRCCWQWASLGRFLNKLEYTDKKVAGCHRAKARWCDEALWIIKGAIDGNALNTMSQTGLL
jgi:hypothetical protein